MDKWTNETTFSATPWKNTNPVFHSDIIWLKIVDDNTNLKFSISPDGVVWDQIFSETRTTFMAGAPNQIGFTINNGGNSSARPGYVRLLHWNTE